MARRFCNLRHRGSGAHCHKPPGHGLSHAAWTHYPAQMVVWDEQVRQDIRGRRIGYNWWREYNCSLLLDASLVWERECEEVALGYPTEIAEYVESHPRPTLKAFLIANKGMSRKPD